MTFRFLLNYNKNIWATCYCLNSIYLTTQLNSIHKKIRFVINGFSALNLVKDLFTTFFTHFHFSTYYILWYTNAICTKVSENLEKCCMKLP